jgi:flagellar basal-body rod protein FlgF
MADGGTAAADAGVQIASGVLEGSNVDITTAMVNMIELSRQYEQQIKMMSTADQNAQSASALLRSQG